jgi:YjbE family integral membrane protein
VAAVTINPEFVAALIQIIWINIILSGDNAVVIAMACRDLPAKTKNKGIILGAAAAIGLRIIFSFVVTFLMALPFLRVIGGLLLFWIAFDLLNADDGHGKEIKGHDRLFHAVKTIAIADVVMSLDNVLAIAAIAKDLAGARPSDFYPADHCGLVDHSRGDQTVSDPVVGRFRTLGLAGRRHDDP